jgi:hypothetical protein
MPVVPNQIHHDETNPCFELNGKMRRRCMLLLLLHFTEDTLFGNLPFNLTIGTARHSNTNRTTGSVSRKANLK